MPEAIRPKQLSDALDALTGGNARIAAGCTDLFAMTEAAELQGRWVDITGLADLRGIVETGSAFRIGAATRWAEVMAHPLPAGFDGLKAAAREIGAVQIQNSGTVGGNLCNASPAADGVPPLLTLAAEVELVSTRGSRTLPLADFLTGPRRTALAGDEVMTAILVPKAATRGVARFRKLGARHSLVISIVMAAGRLVVRDGRVDEIALAVGAASSVARRMAALEQALAGQPLAGLAARVTPELATAGLSPIDDIRASAAYRLEAATIELRTLVGDLAAEAEAAP